MLKLFFFSVSVHFIVKLYEKSSTNAFDLTSSDLESPKVLLSNCKILSIDWTKLIYLIAHCLVSYSEKFLKSFKKKKIYYFLFANVVSSCCVSSAALIVWWLVVYKAIFTNCKIKIHVLLSQLSSHFTVTTVSYIYVIKKLAS